MRPAFIVTLMALSCAAGVAHADDGGGAPDTPPPSAAATFADDEPANAITLEPLAVVFGRAFALEYERRVTDGWTFFVQPSVVFGASRLTGTTDEEVGRGFSGIGVGLTSGVRLFPFDRGLEGFFVSAFISAAWANAADADGASRHSYGLGAGAMAGYTFILGGAFDLSLGARASYFEVHFDTARATERGVQPAIRAAIGAAF